MKTTAECYQALLDGETLVSRGGNRVALLNGAVLYTGTKEPALAAFSNPESWQIYRAPEWWEKIEEPVLCYVDDYGLSNDKCGIRLVTCRQPDGWFEVENRTVFKYANPVQKEELLKMIAALEAVGESSGQ